MPPADPTLPECSRLDLLQPAIEPVPDLLGRLVHQRPPYRHRDARLVEFLNEHAVRLHALVPVHQEFLRRQRLPRKPHPLLFRGCDGQHILHVHAPEERTDFPAHNAPCNFLTASSTSARVMFNGGKNRITCVPACTPISPWPASFAITGLASTRHSTPIINPKPRTSFTGSGRSFSMKYRPTSRTFGSSFSTSSS